MDVRENDFYPTPAPLTLAFLRAQKLPKKIWEPAAGMGHMATVLAAAGHEVYATDLIDYGHRVPGSPEIDAPIDFLEDASPLNASWAGAAIVTNPPFSLAAQFVRRGLQLCPMVCVLGRLAFLEGKGRSDILDHHLIKVFPFVRRPPMLHRWSQDPDGVWREWDGKKADSAMAYAWYVFEREKSYRDPRMQRITWLDADLL